MFFKFSPESPNQFLFWYLVFLTLFDMGGMMGPQNFLSTVPERLGGGSWNLVTFNINLCGIKKVIFGSLGYTSLSGSSRDFLKLLFHMFPYNEILKDFKNKIWLHIWKEHTKIPLNSKFQRDQSGPGFGSYEHLKFRPARLLNASFDVIIT